MKDAIKKGLGFGVSSAVITTLGVMVGIHSGTDLKHAVIGAILVIAFTDSMADSLGIYFSEKSRHDSTQKECFTSMAVTFFSKFLFALTFLIPIILFDNLHIGIIINLVYGLLLLAVVTFRMAKEKNESIMNMMVFHIALAIFVIIASHFIGVWVNLVFGGTT